MRLRIKPLYDLNTETIIAQKKKKRKNQNKNDRKMKLFLIKRNQNNLLKCS